MFAVAVEGLGWRAQKATGVRVSGAKTKRASRRATPSSGPGPRDTLSSGYLRFLRPKWLRDAEARDRGANDPTSPRPPLAPCFLGTICGEFFGRKTGVSSRASCPGGGSTIENYSKLRGDYRRSRRKESSPDLAGASSSDAERFCREVELYLVGGSESRCQAFGWPCQRPGTRYFYIVYKLCPVPWEHWN